MGDGTLIRFVRSLTFKQQLSMLTSVFKKYACSEQRLEQTYTLTVTYLDKTA